MENFRFMSSETIKLTVVQLDLVNSSKSTAVIESELGLDGTELFRKRIRKLVDKAFDSVPNPSKYDGSQSLGGDGYRILFQKVDNAYKFVENFCKYVEEYNSEPHVKKRIFRIGAVTGNVKYNPSELGLDKITGHVLVTLSRLVTAESGWFYVDEATFDLLNEDVRQDFIKVLVKSKEHEEDIPAWRCQKIYNSDSAENLGKGIQLEMMLIPGGTFIMGSPKEEEGSDGDERPQHQVTIKPFFMGRYQVTQAQWQAVAAMPKVNRELDPDPSSFKGANRPVEGVSWHEAVEFCSRLSQHTGKNYRLPSEAEWEYACRAGTTTPFHFGKTITTDSANYDGNYTYGDGVKGVYRKETTEVGNFGVANNFGLYDMHGNVWEWCLDDWHSNYEDAPTNGSAWFSSDEKLINKTGQAVLRGGSWVSYPNVCRSAFRYDLNRVNHDYYIGFRVVCAVGRILQ
jgi:formylglycine-generating enzyme required for sulfatase activity